MSTNLTDRWQYLSDKGLLSNTLHVTRGVPQGSIYANDILKQLKHSRNQMCADDIELYLDGSKERHFRGMLLKSYIMNANMSGICLIHV